MVVVLYILVILTLLGTVGDKIKFLIPFHSTAVKRLFFTVVFIVVFRTILTKRPTLFTKTVKKRLSFSVNS